MPIQEVLYESRPPAHEDERRTLTTAFDGDLGGFRAAQVKILQLKKDSVLGNHFHDYAELFLLLDGEGRFTLEDSHTKEREAYRMTPRHRLYIPPLIAHRADMKAGSVLIGCTEQPFSESTDHKYQIEI